MGRNVINIGLKLGHAVMFRADRRLLPADVAASPECCKSPSCQAPTSAMLLSNTRLALDVTRNGRLLRINHLGQSRHMWMPFAKQLLFDSDSSTFRYTMARAICQVIKQHAGYLGPF